MNKTIKKSTFYLTLVLALFYGNAIAQDTFVLGEGSRVWVEGTSTLKNWQAEVKTFSGEITTDEAGNITDVDLNLDVKSMDGGRGPDMNAKIYKALKSDEHPSIIFSGTVATPVDGDIATKGILKLAGKELEVLVSATGSTSSGHLKGKHPLKLSDFEIEPPSAMFGQIVCYDDLTIVFDLNITKQNN